MAVGSLCWVPLRLRLAFGRSVPLGLGLGLRLRVDGLVEAFSDTIDHLL
jgi:hypothetical protein